MRSLTFEEVTVRFGSRRHGTVAVDRVDLAVPAGQVVGLVGESGSGKSTLARAAVGLVPLTSGRIHPHPRGGGPVQMVFQDPYSALDPRMTIGASIAEVARGRTDVAQFLEMVGLPAERAGVRPGALSGGQRQRVALARALAGRPEVIVADEITSALDVSIQGAVLNMVRDLQRRMGLTMLFISHNLAVVRYVSDIVAVMRQGKIVEYGPVSLLDEPQHEYTRELLDAVPRP